MKAFHGLLVPLLLSFAACGSPDAEPAAVGGADPLSGLWRGVLASPGGELPFGLEVRRQGEVWTAAVVNGEERAPISRVTVDGSRVRFAFETYDSALQAELSGDNRMDGRWTKTVPDGVSELSFQATREDPRRFLPLAQEPSAALTTASKEGPPESIAGTWRVLFTDESGSEPARGELHQEGASVTGTFLTPTGDYRFLDGRYEAGRLRLSTFDGAHAFLFDARATGEAHLEGNFWSRDSYHATWTAERVADSTQIAEGAEALLPDPWSQVSLTNEDGRFRFSFPDLQGETVSASDPRFEGKVVLVNIFGSWCPNCNDEAPLLARWYQQHRAAGLEVVGLAYEFSGDPVRDRRQLSRFAERHGIEYPLLLAGTSDKGAAAETLPDLSAVLSYPTTIFVDRRGRVRGIHSGFAGPGTGEHYRYLVTEMEGRLEELLAELVEEPPSEPAA